MRHRIRGSALVAVLFALALVAGACGTGGDEPEPGATGGPGATDTETDGGQAAGGDIIVGTTDTVQTIDPAKCYSYYCSNIFQNTGETLMGFEPGASEVSPLLAAEEPQVSEDRLTYTFTLREGVTFHDGSEMTAEDVVFSLNRGRLLQHPEGAAFLLGGIESVEAVDDLTVEVTLSAPDVTFLSKLAYTVATIIPSDGPYEAPEEAVTEAQPAEDLINENEFIGTGPYQLTDLREDESITLEAFGDYWGDAPANDRVLVQFFNESAQLQASLEAGEIDIAFRHLTPEQRASLEGSEDIQTIEGEGASIRYIVLNTLMEPLDDVNVRKAIAAAVDRERIVEEVLAGDGAPLYSMVPPLFEAHEPSFETTYADASAEDFISEPVDLELWYSTDHYAETEPAFAQTIERSLEETGLFNVTLQSTEWAQFTQQAWPGETAQYPAFLLGWYPDYLDADDYLYPFYHSEQSFLKMYSNDEMDQLINQEQSEFTDPNAPERLDVFRQIQDLAAEEASVIPMYEVTPFAFAQQNIEGVQDTMGPSQIFRYYVISKTG
ncbi:MAG: hypothetical protein KY437_01140 [Actinobacteria bacterium]|nr:hypothetical protein [Actinomycetota bacterium]